MQAMAFKLRSVVLVYEYPPVGKSEGGKNHIVLSRERILHPGDRFRVRGDISRDIETKVWDSAEGEIRIINKETIGIRWRLSLADALVSKISGPETEMRELRKWELERIIKGQTPLELGDTYHSSPDLPEVFTLIDLARIKPLTEIMLKQVEGMKSIERKTELIYEP